ncbi:MAG: hypothetical protein JKY65_18000, partial [Planctomycetes bacterium]|nr:hypothetical protein [Planctomycetota bacterium]
APSVALPPEPRRPFLESRRDELAELQRELTRVLDDQVRPSLAPRELLEAQERALPRVAVTRAVRARLLANLGREREALELLARASEDPVPDPTLAAYRVELLLRVSNNKAAIQEGVRRLRAVAQPDTGPEAYFRCVINRRVSPDELVQWTRWSERFDEPYLWAFLAQIEAGNATKRGDAKGLASAAEHWRRYLRLDPGDAIAHFKLSEALYYGHSLTRDPLLIPQINAALRRSRDLVPRPVMWSFVGKSQVTLDQRPRAAIRELREAMRRAEQAGEAGERVRAGGWLVVAYLKAGRDREAEELAAGLRAPYTRGVYRQLRRALPEDLRPRHAELLKEGVR